MSSMMWTSHKFGGSPDEEYQRSAELIQEIYEKQGLYFVLGFLYDSQYGRYEIGKLMKIIQPEKEKGK